MSFSMHFDPARCWLVPTHTLAHAHIPESMLFRNLGHRFAWTLTIFLRYQNPCSKSVMCTLLPGATCTGHRRPSARFADNRCCPAVCIPESVRPMASGKVMPRESELHSRKARARRPDSRKGGEQAAPPMIVATLVQISRHF